MKLKNIFSCCIYCQRWGKSWICSDCRDMFFQSNFRGRIVTIPLGTKIDVDCLFVYNKAVEYAWEQSKNEGYFKIIDSLAELAMVQISQSKQLSADSSDGCYLFVPIPIHSSKLRQRGFNQTELLVQRLIIHLKKKYTANIEYMNLLAKAVSTQTQVGGNRQSRLNKQVNSFIVDSTQLEQISSKLSNLENSQLRVIVVDDIYTTGATMTNALQSIFSALNASASVEKICLSGLTFATP